MFVLMDILKGNLLKVNPAKSYHSVRIVFMEINPVTLTGKVVRLEPLSEAHAKDLFRVGLEKSIWKYMPNAAPQTEEDLMNWIREMLRRQACGSDLPFAAVLLANQQAVGATRYLDIRRQHRSLEIGGTWYGIDFQRTAVNTESKYLLLAYAFETLDCVRVQFKTDIRNLRSQRAIERLGAVREGVLRDHIIMTDGYRRSSVYYSILDGEWPAVKSALEEKLSRKYAPQTQH
jgi:RimJ/RimL family protein N-acetyltransferase